jgi:predicted transcriptional regulator
MTTIELLNLINNDNISIDELLNQIPDLTFHDYLEYLLDEKNMTKSQLIKDSILNREYAYQIFKEFRHPNQDKVIKIALSLKLDLHDTNNLLTLSKNQVLYPKIKRDALIILCINKHYSVMDTNLLLDEYHFPILE